MSFAHMILQRLINVCDMLLFTHIASWRECRIFPCLTMAFWNYVCFVQGVYAHTNICVVPHVNA